MDTSPKRHSTGGKKRGKKFKKYTEKELINEYYYETSQSNLKDQKVMYANMQHLSQTEKNLFEQKFAVPKTRSQEIMPRCFVIKTKKLLSQPDQPEQEKLCLLLNLVFGIFYSVNAIN